MNDYDRNENDVFASTLSNPNELIEAKRTSSTTYQVTSLERWQRQLLCKYYHCKSNHNQYNRTGIHKNISYHITHYIPFDYITFKHHSHCNSNIKIIISRHNVGSSKVKSVWSIPALSIHFSWLYVLYCHVLYCIGIVINSTQWKESTNDALTPCHYSWTELLLAARTCSL